MKKTFFFAAITALLFASCKKEVTQQNNVPALLQENATAAAPVLAANNAGDFLTYKLCAWYAFNNSGIDSVSNGKYMMGAQDMTYVTDRKGTRNSAIDLNGSHDMMTPYIDLQSTASIAVWIKRDSNYTNTPFVMPLTHGPSFWQDGFAFQGGMDIVKDPRIGSGLYMDNNWHHLVATCDGALLKFYVDGLFQGAKPYTSAITMTQYQIGIFFADKKKYWRGTLDDLRFYNRVLTQDDVTALYNL